MTPPSRYPTASRTREVCFADEGENLPAAEGVARTGCAPPFRSGGPVAGVGGSVKITLQKLIAVDTRLLGLGVQR